MCDADILLNENLLGEDLLGAVKNAVQALTEFGLDCQLMPRMRPEITLRVFGLNGQESELVKRLKVINGFVGLTPLTIKTERKI